LPGGQVLREASYSQNVPVGDVLERDKAGKVMKVASYVDGRKVVSKSSVFPGTKDKRTEAIFLSPQTKLSTSDDFWNLKFAKFDLKGEELRNGPWKTWYTNGQVQLEGYYQLDKEVGTFTWWHENGQKAVQGEYTDSHQNSLWIWWHPNGQVASRGEYRNGAKIGQWRRWATDGRLEQQAMFDPKIPDSQQPSENLEFSKNVPVLPWLSR
jgi:antitoxin component YwqK of YwqJK toxin-antitoxin module